MSVAAAAGGSVGGRTSPVRRLLALALVLALLLAGGRALAHASLVHAEPANASVLAQAPANATLLFNEDVTPTRIELVDADGHASAPPAVHAEGATLTVQLPALGQGSHALAWHVVSADGHPVSGVLAFSIGTPGVAPSAGATAAHMPRTLAAAIWLARVAVYLGLFFGVGGVFFRAWVADGAQNPGRPPPAVGVALFIGLAGVCLAPGLQGADMLGLDAARGLSAQAWRTGAASPYGLTLALAAAALLLAGLTRHLPGRGAARAVSLLALACTGLALAASGHASTAPPQWATRPAVWLHGVAATLWLGALLPLAQALRRGDTAALRTLARFSRWIVYPLVVLVGAGVLLASVQLGRPGALLTTDYGRVLALKLALVAALLLLAAWHRWQLTGAVLQGQTGAARRLRRSIAVEAVLVLAVLAVVGLWRFTPPPRALAQAAQAADSPQVLRLHGARAMAELRLSPARVGPVSITAAIDDGASDALAAQAVQFTLSNPAAGIASLRADAQPLSDGRWRAPAVLVPVAGLWDVRVDILLDEFTQLSLQGSVRIQR
ncbi:copper resistance protein CopC [Comamonas flocculans]|uniref:Copper resistance protein n=1 Tax=Comamonas flocculans TaxID=2597701 RepID=A0A5B8RSL0_9BURK|nr:copper resistance protein CopC [Comamonas flocculans]QEA12649.1 copper resistance protein [Comamonas flocculans]